MSPIEKSVEPTFIGVGAQRAGTTWIAACLAEHPEVYVSYPKELCFFNSSPKYLFVSESKNWSKGRSWYEKQFADSAHYHARGEFSVLYMPDSEAASNIHKFYPHVKIIVSLRNPVQRAISAFAHLKRLAVMHKNFPIKHVPEDIFKANELVPGIIEFGKYKAQLAPYFQLFGKEQVKIVIYEDIAENPVKFMQDLFHFLDVDPSFVPPAASEQRNPHSVPRLKFVERSLHISSQILSRLKMGGMVQWFKRKGVPDRIRKWNAQSKSININAKQYIAFQKQYEEDIMWIEELLERTLDIWKYPPE